MVSKGSFPFALLIFLYFISLSLKNFLNSWTPKFVSEQALFFHLTNIFISMSITSEDSPISG